MTAINLELVGAFVRERGLHKSAPVDLGPLYDLYEVRILPFSPAILGMAYANGDVGGIGINASLSDWEQRMVLAHEASHLILRHPNSLFLCQMNDWYYYKLEMEAQRAAALMLLCTHKLLEMALESATLQEMAAAFRVPPELVELRLKMALPQV